MQTVSEIRDLPRQILIRVCYLGATDHKPSRWAASYKRSADEIFRAYCSVNDSADRGEVAALAVLEKVNADRRSICPRDRDWIITAAAHDDDAYYYLATYPAADHA